MSNICAPNSNGKYSCLNMKMLKKISLKINKDKRYGGKKIDIKKYKKSDKKKLVNKIQNKMNCSTKIDFCILKENNFSQEVKDAFIPKGPVKTDKWLSTLDIKKVMKQYEKKYKDFTFLGPFPMDFEDLYDEMANFNLKKMYKQKKRLGIVFNTDTSNGPGEHWVSFFLDMINRTVCFFDSSGDEPQEPVKRLLKKIEKQSKEMKCPVKVVINKKQFQYDNSSCGIYSLFFIITRLNGKSCNYLFTTNHMKDKVMHKKRKEYFRK